MDRLDPRDIAIYAEPSDATGAVAYALGAIGLAMVLVTGVLTVRYRKHPLLVRSSVRVGYALLVALALAMAQPLTMVGRPTNLTCTLDSILLPLAFSLFYGQVYAKSVRLYRIFYGLRSIGGSAKWSDSRVLGLGALPTIPMIVILVVWHVLDAPRPTIGRSGNEYYWTCRSAGTVAQSGAVGALLAWAGAILLLSLHMAVLTRRIDSQYKETRLIALSV